MWLTNLLQILKKTVSSINGVGKMDSYMEKHKTGRLSYTIRKNKFKMSKTLKCKNGNHKVPKRTHQY